MNSTCMLFTDLNFSCLLNSATRVAATLNNIQCDANNVVHHMRHAKSNVFTWLKHVCMWVYGVHMCARAGTCVFMRCLEWVMAIITWHIIELMCPSYRINIGWSNYNHRVNVWVMLKHIKLILRVWIFIVSIDYVSMTHSRNCSHSYSRSWIEIPHLTISRVIFK